MVSGHASFDRSPVTLGFGGRLRGKPPVARSPTFDRLRHKRQINIAI
jgi:hypothetical protein